MNTLTSPVKRKFAVGHFYHGNFEFQSVVSNYLDYITEVFFAWPGLNTARQMEGDFEQRKDQIAADMVWARKNGISLDLLLNALCYGEDAFTTKQHRHVLDAFADLDRRGILPDTITVISPFIAQIVKKAYPHIETRASVNMRVDCTIAMEYLSNIFDGFYISRDLQRDIPTLASFRKWADEHGKKLCMLANGSCLRNCPYHFYHETLNSHGMMRTAPETKLTGIQPSRCIQLYMRKQYVEILRSCWIRPEDLHYYEGYADVIKLSTREVTNPDAIIKAYVTRSFDGNLLDLLDPYYSFFFRPKIIDNKRFPADWVESRIGGKCATNCTHCGRCEKVLAQVLVDDPEFAKRSVKRFSLCRTPLVIPSSGESSDGVSPANPAPESIRNGGNTSDAK